MSQKKGLDIQTERQSPQGTGMVPVVQSSGFWTHKAQRQLDSSLLRITGITDCRVGEETWSKDETYNYLSSWRLPQASGRTGCSDVRKIAITSGARERGLAETSSRRARAREDLGGVLERCRCSLRPLVAIGETLRR